MDRKTLIRIIKAYVFKQEVDLSEIMSNELMTVPPSLAEFNGSLRSGDKALLQNKLLENIESPDTINLSGKTSCLIIDGQALICSLGKGDNSKTFKYQAKLFIQIVLRQSMSYDRIDTVFDRYRDDSMKTNTRNKRNKSHRPIRKFIEHEMFHYEQTG